MDRCLRRRIFASPFWRSGRRHRHRRRCHTIRARCDSSAPRTLGLSISCLTNTTSPGERHTRDQKKRASRIGAVVTDTAASPFSPAPPDPEIAAEALVGDLRINYHDVGDGSPLLLLHGSGPGVSAWANWRLVIPGLAQAGHRVVAPDIPGFGYSDPVPGFSIDRWLDAISGLLDHLGLDKVSIVGNSFGGALALHLATSLPDRVDRAVVMGSAGVSFQLTEGLEKVWAYEPSGEAMLELLRIFAYNPRFATRELAELRFKASVRPGAQEAYSALFPEPRQRW